MPNTGRPAMVAVDLARGKASCAGQLSTGRTATALNLAAGTATVTRHAATASTVDTTLPLVAVRRDVAVGTTVPV